MTVDVVVDVGNTRIKWGRCQGGVIVGTAALAPDDAVAWQTQRDLWRLTEGTRFVLAGVHPPRRGRLADWLQHRGDEVRIIEAWDELPLQVRLEKPEQVGIDRLLDAVAVNSRRAKRRGAIVIDVGSAITVDWVDETGAFAGGAIFPGIRLMALALHQYTALLPLIETPSALPPLPGGSTRGALAAGIVWAAAGGIRALIDQYTARASTVPHVFLTGGDGALLQPALGPVVEFWPDMTLEGIRLAAEWLS